MHGRTLKFIYQTHSSAGHQSGEETSSTWHTQLHPWK